MTKHYTLFSLLLFAFCAVFSQTSESFTHLPTLDPVSAYGSFSWTGDNGLTWSATDSRTDQSMTGKAIVVRNGYVSCDDIPNGISSITFKHLQFFSKSGGNLDVYINGIKVGSAHPTTTLATFTLSNLNIAGNFDLQIIQTTSGLRIGIDDLSWQSYNAAPCIEPTAQPTGLMLASTTNSVSGTFTAASPSADEYLVVRSTSPTLDASPQDGTSYSEGSALGTATVAAVVASGLFTDDGLAANTNYYYFIFAMNNANCSGAPNYLAASPLNGMKATQPLPVCVVPATTASAINLTPSGSSVSGSFAPAADASSYLVVVSTATSLSESPSNGVVYTQGQALGGGTVVGWGTNTYFTATGLTSNTTYHFFIFSANDNCTGTPPLYNLAAATAFTQTTATTGIPSGYYNTANGLACGALKSELRNIISSGSVELTYTPGVWQAFQYTDMRRNDANTADIIWDMYSDNPSGPDPYTYTYQIDQCGNYSKEGDCYNREHSTPKSWFNDQYPMYSDIHHLFPTDGQVNNYRSNYPYGEVTTISQESLNHSKLGTGNNFGYTGIVFEPINEYKGDFARASLYMATRYENEIIAQNWSANLNANDLFLSATDEPDANMRKLQIYDDWYVKLLFKWIQQDPVSQKEIDRNDAIYYLSGQHNRNPFIDHPEFAAAIWSCSGALPVTLISFDALKQTNGILLKWHSTFETQFSHFEIMRSEDGTNFYKIGTVKGGNLSNYYFTDSNVPEGNIVYYRLKMVDLDGGSDLSRIVSVRLNNNYSNGIVYPNPVSGTLQIKLDKSPAPNSKLQIIDITGRVLKTRVLQSFANVVKEQVADLPQGRYFARIYNNEEVVHCSFVIIR